MDALPMIMLALLAIAGIFMLLAGNFYVGWALLLTACISAYSVLNWPPRDGS